jgi:hypothetical protein
VAEETGIVTTDLESAAVTEFSLTRPARREYAAVYRLVLRAMPQLAGDKEVLDFRWWDPSSLPEDVSRNDASKRPRFPIQAASGTK